MVCTVEFSATYMVCFVSVVDLFSCVVAPFFPACPCPPCVFPVLSLTHELNIGLCSFSSSVIFLYVSSSCLVFCLVLFGVNHPAGPPAGHIIRLVVSANSKLVSSGLGLRALSPCYVSFRFLYFVLFLFFLFLFFYCLVFHPSPCFYFIYVNFSFVRVSTQYPDILWLQVTRDGIPVARSVLLLHVVDTLTCTRFRACL